jgi:hypothetical protein
MGELIDHVKVQQLPVCGSQLIQSGFEELAIDGTFWLVR